MLRAAIAMLAATVVLAVSAMDAQALKPRPTVGGINQCDQDTLEGTAESGCDGEICWCCYSDGCFICNHIVTPGSEEADCVWDSAYSATTPPGGSSMQTFQISPGMQLLLPADPPPTGQPPVTGPLDGAVSQ